MVKIGLREANQRFSKYLKMVKEGEEVLLTERGKAVAVIKPVAPEKDLEEDRVKFLEARGTLKRSKKEGFPLHRLITLSGKPLSEIVREEREDRL